MAEARRAILLGQLQARLNDVDSVLTVVDQEDALDQALEAYSRDRPRERIQDLTGDGTTTLFALPTDWHETWSTIQSIELPQGTSPAQYLAREAYTLYRDTGDTLKLRFVSAPASGDVARVRYTTVQTAESLPTRDERAVATLAAAIGLQWIANQYAGQSDSAFGSDVAAHTERAGRYAARAREMRERYRDLVPVRPRTRLEVVRV